MADAPLAFDSHTGEIDCSSCAERQQQIGRLQASVEGLGERLETLKAQRTELQAEIARLIEGDAPTAEVEEVWAYYLDTIIVAKGKQPKRYKLGDKHGERAKSISARIVQYGTEDCKRAIDGAAVSKPDPNGHTYDSVLNIFRNEENFERNRQRADDHERKERERVERERRKEAERRRSMPAWDRLFLYLRHTEGVWDPTDDPDVYIVPCPACTVPSYAQEDDGSIRFDCKRGCDSDKALASFEWYWAEAVDAIRENAKEQRAMIDAAIELHRSEPESNVVPIRGAA